MLCILLVMLYLTGCAKAQTEPDIDPAHIKVAEEAIAAIKERWEQEFTEWPDSTNGYLEIKNTRIIKIKDEPATSNGDATHPRIVSLFGEAEYIVEFILYSDYFGCSLFGNKPYYFNVCLYDSVTIRKDGSMEVNSTNPFEIYRSRSYEIDFSGIIEDIIDLSSACNAVYDLN